MAVKNIWLMKFKRQILRIKWHESSELPVLITPMYENINYCKRGGDESDN